MDRGFILTRIPHETERYFEIAKQPPNNGCVKIKKVAGPGAVGSKTICPFGGCVGGRQFAIVDKIIGRDFLDGELFAEHQQARQRQPFFVGGSIVAPAADVAEEFQVLSPNERVVGLHRCKAITVSAQACKIEIFRREAS